MPLVPCSLSAPSTLTYKLCLIITGLHVFFFVVVAVTKYLILSSVYNEKKVGAGEMAKQL